ncbi:hypothetical protein [Herminiimonas fonticola]|uniref:Uncharacterized protein n=1 Tax=Herminiimonas fonticola TaxID=303380 RepID=A0A4R6GHZ3_9BURK|nr:hypothetical protein [Herminiimonas fonticola]RBA25498.1 hypothetical protein Hfont_1131 [Herminiimonas fonticola]TDN94611.1 hypothetical protein EV677_1162 [Herminiimonas fonticola]
MLEHFLKNNEDMLSAAAHCIEVRQYVPAQVLLYSHIDTLAWAGSSKGKIAIGESYEAWVSTWLLPELVSSYPTLTASELYAARCGMVHTLTGTSRLSSAGKARRIGYAAGTANAQAMDDALASTKFAGQIITLHYDVLLRALRRSIDKFIASSSEDAELLQNLEAAAKQHYQILPDVERNN